MDYRREIDGLRALAVLPVILFHAGAEMFRGGFVGVDVFFVISGYLITTIILAELEQGRFSIVNFYERRARRILPALFLVMLVCIPFAWFFLLPGDMKDFSQSLAAVSVFASNILFWRESGYFHTAAELKPLLHTWSLAVEEQYYLLFPLFLMLSWRMSKRRMWIVLIGVFVVSFALAHLGANMKPAAAFYLLPTRGWELLVGAFAAFYLSRGDRREFGRGFSEIGGWLGVALIFYAVFTYSRHTPFPGFHALVPTVGTLFVILFATQKTTAGKFVGNRIFVGIGLISYSAYIWHQPLFAFAKHSGLTKPGPAVFYGLSILALVLAYFSWRFVEAPFRRKNVFTRRQIFSFAAAGSLAFTLVGFLGQLDVVIASKFGRKNIELITNLSPSIECTQGYEDDEPKPCVLGKPDGSALIIAVGDSHMGQWADALHQIGLENNIRIDMFAKSACANASIEYYYADYGRVYEECTVWRNKVVEEIRKSSPGIVFLTNSSEGYVKTNGDFPAIDHWKLGVDSLLRDISTGNSRVLWLVDNPRFRGFDPFRCYQQRIFFGKEVHDCSSSRHRAISSNIVTAENEAIARQSGIFVDFTDFYCDDEKCKSVIDSIPIMRDTNHLTVAATMMLKERLEALLLSNLRQSHPVLSGTLPAPRTPCRDEKGQPKAAAHGEKPQGDCA